MPRWVLHQRGRLDGEAERRPRCFEPVDKAAGRCTIIEEQGARGTILRNAFVHELGFWGESRLPTRVAVEEHDHSRGLVRRLDDSLYLVTTKALARAKSRGREEWAP